MKKEIYEQIIAKIQTYNGLDTESDKSEEQLDELVHFCCKLIIAAEVQEIEILEFFHEKLPEEVYSIFERNIEMNLTPYHELRFLRERETIEQKKVIKELFERTILVTDDLDGIEQELMLDKHEIDSTRKLLTTLRRSIVFSNLSSRLGSKLIREFFGFSFEVAEFTAQLYCDNREKIQYSALCARIANLEELLEPIEPILTVLNDVLQVTD